MSTGFHRGMTVAALEAFYATPEGKELFEAERDSIVMTLVAEGNRGRLDASVYRKSDFFGLTGSSNSLGIDSTPWECYHASTQRTPVEPSLWYHETVVKAQSTRTKRFKTGDEYEKSVDSNRQQTG